MWRNNPDGKHWAHNIPNPVTVNELKARLTGA